MISLIDSMLYPAALGADYTDRARKNVKSVPEITT